MTAFLPFCPRTLHEHMGSSDNLTLCLPSRSWPRRRWFYYWNAQLHLRNNSIAPSDSLFSWPFNLLVFLFAATHSPLICTLVFFCVFLLCFFFRNKINNWFGCACEWMPIVARFVFVAIHAVNDRSWRRTFIYLYIIPALALSFLLQYNDTSHNWVYYCYELQHLSSEHLSCQVLVFLRWFIIGLTSGEC